MDTQTVMITILATLGAIQTLHQLFRRARHNLSDKSPEVGQVFIDPRTGFLYVEAAGKMMRVNATVTEVSKDTMVVKR